MGKQHVYILYCKLSWRSWSGSYQHDRISTPVIWDRLSLRKPNMNQTCWQADATLQVEAVLLSGISGRLKRCRRIGAAVNRPTCHRMVMLTMCVYFLFPVRVCVTSFGHDGAPISITAATPKSFAATWGVSSLRLSGWLEPAPTAAPKNTGTETLGGCPSRWPNRWPWNSSSQESKIGHKKKGPSLCSLLDLWESVCCFSRWFARLRKLDRIQKDRIFVACPQRLPLGICLRISSLRRNLDWL